ncbi:hypothetical protein GCM10008910_36410 [Faecalicatena orotica]|uniref:Uncharacterized protein n=1 Tax=Faecalicatena orotica TaxID=1544 RepID=A0A2Y9C512_9FIRM|nr:hypothetical protein [Faecalicatena orotica]PWJ29733.1 hypothetical protein A8806_10533 [Faecalicatena orotica]SSA55457.1 hypothetical protein SAMN05216536_10533 [Faecalicatena orotica]
MFYDGVEVAGIKMSVAGIESLGISSKQVLLKSIKYLRSDFEKFQEAGYLKKAMWHIYAYMELGHPFCDVEEEFHIILDYLHLNKKDVFPDEKWLYKAMPLNKSVIRNILGKWSPNLHSMKIADAVQDIMKNITEKREGVYTYYSGKVLAQEGDKTLWDKTFKLYIQSDEAILYDVNSKKYYTF